MGNAFSTCQILKFNSANGFYKRVNLIYNPAIAHFSSPVPISIFNPQTSLILRLSQGINSLSINFPYPIWRMEIKKSDDIHEKMNLSNIRASYNLINHDGRLNMLSSISDSRSIIPISIIEDRIEITETEESKIFSAYIQLNIDLTRIYRSGKYYGKIISSVTCFQ